MTINLVRRYHQLEGGAGQPSRLIGFGIYHHALSHGGGASGNRVLVTINLDKA